MKLQIARVKFKDSSYQYFFTNTIECHPSWFSHVDESNIREKVWNILPGDIVFDIGAMYGSYTLRALSKGALKVYAWSPESGPGDLNEKDTLEKSLELNGWKDRAVVYDYGFYNKSGWLNTETGEFFDKDSAPIETGKFIIRVITFDEWFLANSIPDNNIWVKIDVEGAEVQVLEGASNFLQYKNPTLMIENHLFKDKKISSKVESVLSKFGYKKLFEEDYDQIEILNKINIGVIFENLEEANISHSIYKKM